MNTLHAAVLQERGFATRRMTGIRLVAVGSFFGLTLLLGVGLEQPGWQNDVRFFFAYLVVTALLYVAARRNSPFASHVGFAIALVDVPAVCYLQWTTFPTSPSTSGVAGFTVAIYAFLILLAGLALDARMTWLTACTAVICEVLLQYLGGVAPGGMVAAALLLFLCAWTSLHAGKRVVTMVERIANELAERKRMEQQVLVADRLSSMGQLVAGVAHEINNPLTYVAVNIDMVSMALEQILAENPTPAKLREQLEDMRAAMGDAGRGAERLKAIVGDLKRSSRAHDDIGVADVLEIVNSSVNVAHGEIKSRARLVRDLAPVAQAAISPTRLGQVVLNLLVNAAQAIPQGKPQDHQIRVATTQENQSVIIEVSDTGSGIPVDILDRIFEPFFTTKPPGEGTGLGLSICHGIVTKAGGRLEVFSQVGKGTTFKIILPQAAQKAA